MVFRNDRASEGNVSNGAVPKDGKFNFKETTLDVEIGSGKKQREAPTDGGWGWMVVLGSFVVHFMALSATHKAFGVLFVEFREKFNATAQATSWVTSIARFVTLVTGPLSKVLSAKLSARWTVCIGGGFCCLGYLLSMLSPNLAFLYFSYGILVGVGAGLAYSPTIATVGSYFTKRRALAMGLGAAGSGVGSLALPPLLTYLIEQYTLYGTLFIMAGMMLNILVGGALLRGRDFYTKSRLKSQTVGEVMRQTGAANGGFSRDGEKPRQFKAGDTQHSVIQSGIDNAGFSAALEKKSRGLEEKSRGLEPASLERDLQVVRTERFEAPPVVKQKESTPGFQWDVIKLPVIYTYGLSTMFLHGGMPLVPLYMVAFGQSVGLSDVEAAFLVSLYGLGDLTGRIVMGLVADYNIVPKMWFYVCGGLAGAATVLIMVHVNGNLVALCALCFIFGAGSGNIFGMIPVLMAEALEPEKLHSGFSMLQLFMGVPFLFVPALGGYLADVTGRWDATFYMAASMMLVGSVIPLFLKCKGRAETDKPNKNSGTMFENTHL